MDPSAADAAGTGGAQAGDEQADRTGDVLDQATVERIEELHTAVLRAEAEHRFGVMMGRRPRPLSEAEGAERDFLAEHGFATYNDFRLRIRRSTAPDLPRRTVAEQVGDSFGGSGPAVAPGPSTSRPPAPVAAPQPPRPGPAAGSADVTGPADELRRRVAQLLATCHDDTESLISLQVEQVERRRAEILARASAEAREITGRAWQASETVTLLAQGVTSACDRLVAATEGVAAVLAELSGDVAVLHAIRARCADVVGPVTPA